jgi:hypothetical protein
MEMEMEEVGAGRVEEGAKETRQVFSVIGLGGGGEGFCKL